MKVQRESAIVISGIAVVLVAAIGGAIAIGGGNDIPVAATTAAPPSGSAAAVPAPVTKTVTGTAVGTAGETEPAPVARSAKPAGGQLDHFGRGRTKLGMGYAEVEAAGLLSGTQPLYEYCTWFPMAGTDAQIGISAARGVEVISAGAGEPTPEGIRVGSTVDELRAAYPDLVDGANGYYVELPDSGAHYYFVPTAERTVGEFSVNLKRQGCYN